MSTAKFIVISGPYASYERVNAIENRTLYNCPEAYKWDKHVAKIANHIIDKDEPCAIITQSDIVINQFLIRLKNKELKIENVEMYFINEDNEVEKLDVQQHGRIRKAPNGFMDQYRDDLCALL
jgi:predicted ATPase